MNIDVTLQHQRRNNDLWKTLGMQRFANDNKGTKEVSHKVNADNETIYVVMSVISEGVRGCRGGETNVYFH